MASREDLEPGQPGRPRAEGPVLTARKVAVVLFCVGLFAGAAASVVTIRHGLWWGLLVGVVVGLVWSVVTLAVLARRTWSRGDR